MLGSRLLLEAAYRDLPLFGGALSPALEVGVRYEAGDAERGAGLVVGGGVEYRLAAVRLSLSVRGQGLLLHESAGFREWSAGGALRFDPGAQGRGVALSVAPSWGLATVDSQRLWAAPGATLPVSGAAPPAGLGRLDAELSYGVALPGERGLLTPYVRVAHGAADRRRGNLGVRLQVAPGLDLSLEAIRQEQAAGTPSDTLRLNATIGA